VSADQSGEDRRRTWRTQGSHSGSRLSRNEINGSRMRMRTSTMGEADRTRDEVCGDTVAGLRKDAGAPALSSVSVPGEFLA